MHVRVCPECDEEYRPDIAVCADCGAELVDRYEDERGRSVQADGTPAPEPDAAEPEAPGEPGRALFSGPAFPMKDLADTLVAAGVPFQIVPEDRGAFRRNEGARLILVVPEPETERALAALAEFRGRGTEMGLSELAQTWSHDGAEAPCPACGSALPADADTCPDCGLELGGSEPQ